MRKAGRIQPLPEAVAALVRDGSFVSLEGFTHLIPFAAGHEVLRQGHDRSHRRPAHAGRPLRPDDRPRPRRSGSSSPTAATRASGRCTASATPSSTAGRGRSSSSSTPTPAWPTPTWPGASNLPFGTLRGYAGTDLPEHNDDVAFIDCPFTGEKLTAVRAINPDVAIIHAQQADRQGNVQLWGLSGVQKEAVLAAKHAIVTVEEVVDELTPKPRAVVLPSWVLDAVCHVPNGAWPSYAADFSVRDNGFYSDWDAISRDRDRFTQWMEENVLAADAPVGAPVVAR